MKLQNIVTNNVSLDKKYRQQQNNYLKKSLAGAGYWNRDLSLPKRMRHLCNTESTESNDWSQAIYLFRRNRLKRK